jgi:putative hydrolase of the HAD superfamily
MDYLEAHGLQPAPWEHQILYDVFESHDSAYSPDAPAHEKQRYFGELAERVFERTRVRASHAAAADHADALWHILGPASFSVFPDALSALQELRARGIPLAVVSNWQSGLRHFCAELGIAGFFRSVLCSADVGAAKPDPRIFAEACARVGVPSGRTLHVGDTYVEDYVGALQAGLRAVLLDRPGHASAADLQVVRSLTDVSAFVRR